MHEEFGLESNMCKRTLERSPNVVTQLACATFWSHAYVVSQRHEL